MVGLGWTKPFICHELLTRDSGHLGERSKDLWLAQHLLRPQAAACANEILVTVDATRGSWHRY